MAAACALACAAPSTATTAALPQDSHAVALLSAFRPIGAVGNNLSNPALNPVPGSPEVLLAPLNFKPGTRNGLVDGPNPRTVSNVIAGGTGANGEDAQTTDTRASAWLYVFGQFVDHDISLESNLPGGIPINIPVPPGDPVFRGTSIKMTRNVRHPRTNTIVNTVAGFLDLSQLYGSTPALAASLRNADGTLKTSNGGLALQIVNNRFVTGDPRVNENPELAAVTILFMREHNFWVGELKNQNPGWNGNQLYEMARAITTAEYQNVIYNEYLPVLVGPAVGSYRGYDPRVNAQVSQEFSTVAFRVGHTQVSETQSGIDNRGNDVFTQSLADAFFNTAQQTLQNGIDPLLRNVTAEFSQATDVYTVPVLRNLLFAPLPGGNVDQVDLIAIDIQRARDAGVASLAQMRRALGLPQYSSFADLTPDPRLQAAFRRLYGTIDKVDLFMGGQAERHARGAVVGPTFQAIIARQFRALRDGDRFYWQNQPFDAATASTIASTKLSRIILRNTDTTNLAENAFIAATRRPHAAAPGSATVTDTHGFEQPFTTQ
jgi:peroxidase